MMLYLLTITLTRNTYYGITAFAPIATTIATARRCHHHRPLFIFTQQYKGYQLLSQLSQNSNNIESSSSVLLSIDDDTNTDPRLPEESNSNGNDEDEDDWEYEEFEALSVEDFYGSEWKVGTLRDNSDKIEETWVRLLQDGDQAIWGDGAKGKWKLDVPNQFLTLSKETFGGWGGKKIWACQLEDYYFIEGTVRGWAPWSAANVFAQWQARRLGVDEGEAGIAPWFEREEEEGIGAQVEEEKQVETSSKEDDTTEISIEEDIANDEAQVETRSDEESTANESVEEEIADDETQFKSSNEEESAPDLPVEDESAEVKEQDVTSNEEDNTADISVEEEIADIEAQIETSSEEQSTSNESVEKEITDQVESRNEEKSTPELPVEDESTEVKEQDVASNENDMTKVSVEEEICDSKETK